MKKLYLCYSQLGGVVLRGERFNFSFLQTLGRNSVDFNEVALFLEVVKFDSH